MTNFIKIEDKHGFIYVNRVDEIICFKDEIDENIKNNEIKVLVFFISTCNEHGDMNRAALQQLFQWLEKLPVPSTAVMDGCCHGEYLELAMMCDIRLGGEKLSVNFPYDESSFTLDFRQRCQILMGMEFECDEFEKLLGKSLNLQDVMKLRLINQTIDMEDSINEVKRFWVKLLGDKGNSQIRAIMKCFNNYKFHGLDKNRELLLEEESKQFCWLVVEEYLTKRDVE